jgi:hypothetical protein
LEIDSKLDTKVKHFIGFGKSQGADGSEHQDLNPAPFRSLRKIPDCAVWPEFFGKMMHPQLPGFSSSGAGKQISA